MSVQSELDRIISAIGAAYDAVEAKGGTVPQRETVAGLAAAVQSIQTGGSFNAQAKTATPSFAQQQILPDEGYDGLSQVTVAAIPVAYVDNDQNGKTVIIG